MPVARLGEDLVVRLPQDVVDALQLREGDEVAVEVAGGRIVAGRARRGARGRTHAAARPQPHGATRLSVLARRSPRARRRVTGVVLHSNVRVYALTKGDPRQAVAARLLHDSIGAISVQVLNEVASVAHRKLKLSRADIAETLAELRALCQEPRAVTLATH